MPRALDSINKGGFVEEVSIDEREFKVVLGLLEIESTERSEHAAAQLRMALEDFQTARNRTVRAKSIRDDLRDLKALTRAVDPDDKKTPIGRALEALASIAAENPVLHRRLKWKLGSQQLREWAHGLQTLGEPDVTTNATILPKLRALAAEIQEEDGRGRPTDDPARAFASRLSVIWHEYTGRGTSRQNRPTQEKDPFGDFVDAAGKLIDPTFKGHHQARAVHEARMEVARESKQ